MTYNDMKKYRILVLILNFDFYLACNQSFSLLISNDSHRLQIEIEKYQCTPAHMPAQNVTYGRLMMKYTFFLNVINSRMNE
jgi:hypothetical protein